MNWSTMKVTVLRLMPGDDLRSRLLLFACDQELEAAIVIAAVGSLTEVRLRLADQKDSACFPGKHEIVSLTGTLSNHGAHLHLAVSNSAGRTIGGHVVDGSIIYTTAEIAVAQLDTLAFRRAHCEQSGFRELVIESRTGAECGEAECGDRQ